MEYLHKLSIVYLINGSILCLLVDLGPHGICLHWVGERAVHGFRCPRLRRVRGVKVGVRPRGEWNAQLFCSTVLRYWSRSCHGGRSWSSVGSRRRRGGLRLRLWLWLRFWLWLGSRLRSRLRSWLCSWLRSWLLCWLLWRWILLSRWIWFYFLYSLSLVFR